MPTLEQYRRKLQGQQRVIKEQRRKAADLNNELAWELADGHQDVQVLTRTAIDDIVNTLNLHDVYEYIDTIHDIHENINGVQLGKMKVLSNYQANGVMILP